MKVVITIAGSDSGGGAGIQADLRSISANGGFGGSVVTAVTAQNTQTVTMAEELPTALIEAQFDAVFSDLPVAAVKTGMLASSSVIETVAAALRKYRPPFFVLDPVMVSKSGYRLLADEAKGALREKLFPLATVITPNVHEAEALTQREVRSRGDAEDAGRQLLQDGPGAVLDQGWAPADGPGDGHPRHARWRRGVPRRVGRHEAHPRHRLHLLRGHRHTPGARPVSVRGGGRVQGLRHGGYTQRYRHRPGSRTHRPFLLPASRRLSGLGPRPTADESADEL